MKRADLREMQRILGGAGVVDFEQRVRWLDQAATLLIDSGTAHGLYLGGAIASWLERGGNLPRDFLKVTPYRSKRTASRVWHELRARDHHDDRSHADGLATLRPGQAKAKGKRYA